MAQQQQTPTRSKPDLTFAPIAKWTRTLMQIKQEDPDDYRALVNHPNLDLKEKFKQEIKFRDENGINFVGLIEGPPGSGKSIGVGLPLCRMIDPRWKPKGQVVFTDDDLVQKVKEAKEGAVIMKDEDPNEGGQGSGSLADALANLESASARFAKIHLIIINPYETSHLISFKFDTSRQESRRANGKLVAVVFDVAAKAKDEDTLEEAWLKIGKMELEVPEEIVPEYQKDMAKFKNELRATGGIGVRRDVYRRYAYLIPRIQADPFFQEIPTKKDGFFNEDHCSYISAYHGVNEKDARLFLLRAWREVKNTTAPTVKQVKKKH